jgi:hypothetical protein
MGRRYSGDINGKFWNVQDSDDADFFGGERTEPNQIEYAFDSDDLESIETGVERCKRMLGASKGKLDAYFAVHDGYESSHLLSLLGLSQIQLNDLLEWYARVELGENILACVKDTGYCTFDAELG